MAASIITIVGLVVGALVWFIKYRADPTPAQQSDQRATMLNDLRSAIVDAERNGQLAIADSLRERLRLLTDPVRYPDGDGQRLAVPTSEGNQTHPAGSVGGGSPPLHGSE